MAVSTAAAARPTSGIYADRVRGIFGMTSGAHSSTSDSASLRKSAAIAETHATTSAANDNRMLAEMQLQTKLLKNIAGQGKFGLTDFLLGSWLGKLTTFAGRGLLAGATSVRGLAGRAVQGVKSAIAMATSGAANLIKGSVMGVIRPIASGISGFFKPLLSVGRSIGGMLRVPSITGVLSGMVKAAPNILKVFGRLASKIFLPITIIMGAIDGARGFFDAEKILGRTNLNIFDRIAAATGSILNGLFLGIPDWIAQRFGQANLTSALDKMMNPVRDLAGWIANGVVQIVDQIKGYIANPAELASRFGNFIKNAGASIGTFIKDVYVGYIDNLKKWIADPVAMGNAVGKFVSTKVVEFGIGIKNNIFGMFDAIGDWARASFENLKNEIMSWMPWNWNVQGTPPPAGSTLNTNPASRAGSAFGGSIVRQPSGQSSPVVTMGTNAPMDTARLASYLGSLPPELQGIVTAATISTVSTAVIQNQGVVQAETVEDALGEVVEIHEEQMEKMTDDMSESFMDKLGGAMAALGLAYKPVADALAGTPKAILDYLAKNGYDVGSVPGLAAAINGLATGNLSNTGLPAGVMTTPGGAIVSNQSGIAPGPASPASTTGYGGKQQPVPYTPSILPSGLGINSAEFGAFREGVAAIENANYNQMGGSSGKYAGRYQMGTAAIADAAALLGVPAPSQAQLLADPIMQEKFFEAFTMANHNALMKNPIYQTMSPRERLGVLAYAHNQGAGGASQWLNTGVGGADAFGTAGTAYTQGVGARLAALDTAAATTSGSLPPSVANMRVKTSSGTATLAELGVTSFEQLGAMGGQAFEGGFNDPNTTYITSKFQELLGDRFTRVTAQNDGSSHAGGPNSHGAGVKTDFTVNGMSYSDAHQQISAYLGSMGLQEGTDFKIISTPHGSGPHIDFALLPSGREKVDQMRNAEMSAMIPEVTQPKMDPVGSMPGFGDLSSFRSPPKPQRSNNARGILGGKYPSHLQSMFADFSGTNPSARLTRDNASVTDVAGIALFGKYNDDLLAEAGVSVPKYESLGRSIAEGILDATVSMPKQPTVIPLETPGNPLAPATPQAAGSEIAKNPTGTPRGATEKHPDLGSMPTMDEMNLMLINTDVLG